MKKTLHLIVGLVIGIGLLWVLFRDTAWGEVFKAIRGARLGWLLAAEAAILVTFLTRVQRWTYVVRTAKPVRFRSLFSATQIGFLANFTLPGRVGEVVRALVLARLAHLPFFRCFAMVALDRVLDLFGLVAVVCVAILAYNPQGVVTIPKETLGWEIVFQAATVRTAEFAALAGLVVVAAAFAVLYVKQDLFLAVTHRVLGRVSQKLAHRACSVLEHFADGLHILRSARDMVKSIAWSLVTWALFILVLQFMFWAFAVKAPWYTVFVVQMLLAVAISVPGAPGFVGQFHAPLIIGLMMLAPGMDPSRAKALAIVIHLLNTANVYAAGVLSLFLEDFSVTELAREAGRAAYAGGAEADEPAAGDSVT